MSNEFNAKNGLIIQNTQPISGISVTVLNDNNTLSTSGAVYKELTGKTDNSLFNTYTGNTNTTLTGKTDVTLFGVHTGDTTIHFTKNSINLSDLGSSAHTHAISGVTGLQTALDNKTDVILFNTYTGNTNATLTAKTDVTLFNTHTGDTSIHFTKNSINLSDLGNSGHTHAISGVTGLQTALDNKTDLTLFSTHTGNTSNPHNVTANQISAVTTTTFNTHTGDTTVHFALSAITLSNIGSSAHTHTISGVTGLQTALNNKADLSGATFTGNIYTPTLSANTINVNSYIDFNVSATTPTSLAGRVFFDVDSNALSYKPITPNMDVTVNIGKENFIDVYNNTGSKIFNGQPVHITGTFNGLPTIQLAVASSNDLSQVSGIATHDIENNASGLITKFGLVHDLNLSGFSNGDNVILSDVAGYLTNSVNNLAFTSIVSYIGIILSASSTNGILLVDINNERNLSNVTERENNVLSSNNLSTGIFDFSGITIESSTTFKVPSIKGWIVDNTTTPINPTISYVNYSGSTGNTTPYLNTAISTYVLITTASTLSYINTYPTPKQRRENIYLGKLVHPDKVNLLIVDNQPDVAISPLSQVRDMFTPIKLINENIICGPNTGLTFNTTSGSLYGLGIGWVYDKENPSKVTISGNTGTVFQYKTQTGGTFSNTSIIDPTKYDLNGALTTISGSNNRATNQRIFLFPTGIVRIQYGQTVYNTLNEAIIGVQSETFTVYQNNKETGILIGVLSVTKGATNLNNTSDGVFIPVSKFGELLGGTGGISLTTLQQAYNNSTTPEIIINSTLDGLSIQNGTGNADNVTFLLEGKSSSATTTSFIRGDGGLSGSSISATTFYGDGSNLTNINLAHSATTGILGNGQYHLSQSEYTQISGNTLNTTLSNYVNKSGSTMTGQLTLPILSANTISANTYHNLPIDIFTTGGTYSNGTAIFTNVTGGTFNVTGFTTPFTGGTVTGATNFSGGLTANTISATTLYGNGSNLIGVNNFYTTASTLNNNVLSFNRTDLLSAYTVDLTVLDQRPQVSTLSGNQITISGNVNTLTNNFNTHTGNTSNPHSVTTAQIGAVAKTGDTMTGQLTLPILSATTITGGTFYALDPTTSLNNIGGQPLHGFVNQTDSTLPATISSITGFTISPTSTSYDIYVNAKKYTISTTKSVNITNTIGQWFIFYTINSGIPILNASQSSWDILDLTAIPVATIYWQGSEGLIGDERHTHNRNLQFHNEAHYAWGSQYISGFVGASFTGAGTTNTFLMPGGIITDEDIRFSISQTSQCRIGYRTVGATAMTFDNASTAWVKLTGNAPRYDKAGTLTTVTNNQYTAYYFYATNGTETNGKLVSIVGQGQATNIAGVQALALPSLPGMTVAEWKLLYRVIVRNSANTLQYIQADPLYSVTTGPAINGGSPSTISEINVTTTPRNFLSGTTQSANNDAIETIVSDLYLNKLGLTGGTLTGQLLGTSLSANTISATTFYGNGANLTGISSGSFTGGTVNGATNFTAGLTANTISSTTITAINSIDAYTATTTNSGTTSLVASSRRQQYFTGSLPQTVTLPQTSTLTLGTQYTISNKSTGVLTIKSFNGNIIYTSPTNETVILTSMSTSVDTAAGWSYDKFVTSTPTTINTWAYPLCSNYNIYIGAGSPTQWVGTGTLFKAERSAVFTTASTLSAVFTAVQAGAAYSIGVYKYNGSGAKHTLMFSSGAVVMPSTAGFVTPAVTVVSDGNIVAGTWYYALMLQTGNGPSGAGVAISNQTIKPSRNQIVTLGSLSGPPGSGVTTGFTDSAESTNGALWFSITS